MLPQLEKLEHELRLLGEQELFLEMRMATLRQQAKEAGVAGRLEESDLAWALFEKARTALSALQIEIARVERKLYGQRRG